MRAVTVGFYLGNSGEIVVCELQESGWSIRSTSPPYLFQGGIRQPIYCYATDSVVVTGNYDDYLFSWSGVPQLLNLTGDDTGYPYFFWSSPNRQSLQKIHRRIGSFVPNLTEWSGFRDDDLGWTQLPTAVPNSFKSDRRSSAIDPGSGNLLLNFSTYGITQTWVYDGTRFSKVLETNVIAEDSYHRVCFDEHRGSIVLSARGCGESSTKTYELSSLPAPRIISFDTTTPSVRRSGTARFRIATDPDIARVELWLDVDNNDVWEPAIDRKVGDAVAGANSKWSASLSARTWPTGNRKIHAVAYEEFTNATFSLFTDIFVVNAIPTIAGITATPKKIATPGAPMTLAAVRPFDPDGTVARVEFFHDRDYSGLPSISDIAFASAVPATGRVNIPTSSLNYGFNQIIGVAVDNDGARSLPARIRVYVNRPPVTTTFSSNVTTVPGNTPFTLTVRGTDVDGSISAAEFWHDVDDNGIFNASVDRKLGAPRQTNGAWNLQTTRGTIAPGVRRFFARVIDNDRIASAPTGPITITFTP